jgi:predicted dinucleotide-binding enzyme
MGRNLARNFARHGHRVAIHNRTYAKTESLLAEAGSEGTFIPSESMADFVASLERPRRVLIMVKAGAGTDAVIDEVTPLLEDGDIVIDAGNAHFPTRFAVRRSWPRSACTSWVPESPAVRRAHSTVRRSCQVGRGSPTSRWVRCWRALPPRSKACRAARM